MSSPPTAVPNGAAAFPEPGGTRDPLSIPPEVKASIKILLVDDERTLRESCASVLQMDGFSVTLAGRGEDARDLVRRRKFDIVLVDLYMSQVSGLELLREVLEEHRDTIVVVMTGHPSVTSSTRRFGRGWDYLQPFSHPSPGSDRPRLARGQRNRKQELRQKVRPAQPQRLGRPDRHFTAVPQGGGPGAEGGAHRRLGLHQRGKRHRQGSHRAVHPSTQPAQPEAPGGDQLRRAARTPARIGDVRPSQGRLYRADRDSRASGKANGAPVPLRLTEMPMASRPSCCGIQDGVVRRVGSESTDAQVDVRFISATNRDPQQAVESGLLRGDLFYRLRVVPIALPPLRKRLEDIPLLTNHFLTHYWTRHRGAAARLPRLSEEALPFAVPPWRGNGGATERERASRGVSSTTRLQPRLPVLRRAGLRAAAIGPHCGGHDEPYHAARGAWLHGSKRNIRQLVARPGANVQGGAAGRGDRHLYG